MSGDFDPYYTWLSIAPEEQPPDHYRLLGLRTFEDNPEVIENASDQRMAHLRTFQSGKHSQQSQTLLNKVAAAKVCLLNPEKKTDYDADLRERMEAAAAATGREGDLSATPAGFSHQIDAEKAEPVTPHESAEEPPDTGKRDRKQAILAGGVVAAVIFLLVMGAFFAVTSGRRPSQDDQQAAETGQQDEILPSRPPTVSPPRFPPKGRTRGNPPKRRRPGGPQTPADPVHVDESPKPVLPVDVTPEPVPPDEPPAADVMPPDVPGPSPPSDTDRPIDTTPPDVGPLPPAARKFPLPSPDEQQEAIRQLNEIYDLSKSRTRPEKLELARELFGLSKKSRGNPAEKFVLLRKAMDLAGEGGDADFMLEAVDAIGADFQMDTLVVKGKMLRSFAEEATDSAAIGSLVEAALRYTEEAVAAGKYDYAANIATTVFQTCQRSRGKDFRKTAFDLRQRVRKLHDEHQELQAATLAVEADPDNRAAHFALGRLYCFGRRDWTRGLPHLAKGSDPELSALAERELAAPAEPAEQAALGDAWWDLADTREGDEKKTLLLHAGAWYKKAQRGLRGLDRAKAAKRLEQIAEIERPVAPKPDRSASKRPSPARATAPIVIADFESKQPWQATGTAFGRGPSTGREVPRHPARGFNGKHLISSYHGGDGATGTLLSRSFTIECPVISFLIGGGNHPGQTCINLLVDGGVVRTATGRNSNTLGPCEWDVSEFMNKSAKIQVVDKRTDGWGHILVDDIIQRPKKSSRENRP